MGKRKPFWKKKKFWAPLVTGVVGALTVLSREVLGLELSAEVQAWIIGAVLMLLSTFLSVDWAEKEQ